MIDLFTEWPRLRGHFFILIIPMTMALNDHVVAPVIARFPTGATGDSTKISLVDLFGLGEFAWLAFRYHPALG